MSSLIKAATAAAFIAFLGIAPSHALVTDPNKIIPARTCEMSQNVCYERVTVNFNDPRISSGVWFATLPKNAYIISVDAFVTTAFNAAGNNYLSIGSTATGVDVLATTGANASIDLTSATAQHATSAAGLGLKVTGAAPAQTALDSAIPLYIRYQQTSTAATAGVVTVILTFGKDNDK